MARGRDGSRLLRHARQHFERGEEQCGLTGGLDDGARDLDAGDLAMLADELDLVALRRRFACQAALQVVGHQLDIFRGGELRERLADHFGRAHAEHVEEARIGEHDILSMHQHGIVHRLDQALEQPLAILEARAAPIQIVEQLVDRSAELRERRGLILDPDAARRQVGLAEGLQLLGKCGNGSLLAALPAQQHPRAHRC